MEDMGEYQADRILKTFIEAKEECRVARLAPLELDERK